MCSSDLAAILLVGAHTSVETDASVATGNARAILSGADEPRLEITADTIRASGGTIRCQGHVKIVDRAVTMDSADLTLQVGDKGTKVFLLNPSGISLVVPKIGRE